MIDPQNNILTPEKVFVCISIFNLLRMPLTMLPYTIKQFIILLVSFGRITNFLNADELDSQKSLHDLNDSDVAMEMSNVTCTWEDPKNPQLKNINVSVKKNKLTAIVGVVGSGKSSLLQGKNFKGIYVNKITNALKRTKYK